MATNVKILLRRGLRNELAGDTLSAGEMGYTTDTNQLYVGVEEAINELRFDPFANAHAVIQSWLDSADCPVSGLTVDEDLVVADIPSGQIDNIITALNTYTQTLVFNSSTATFTVGELLTQYSHKRTILTSPNVIPDEEGIATNFTLEGESISVGGNTITAGSFVIGTKYKIVTAGTTDFTLIGAADSNVDTIFKATGVGAGTGTATDTVTLQSLLTTLQANAAIKAANVIVDVVGTGAASKLFFCKIDGGELNVNFASGHAALGFTTGTNTVAAVTGYDVYANGKITASVPGSSITTVTVQLSETSDYFAYRQEGTGYPYANAPDTSAYFYFGTPSIPDYSALSPAVDTTSVTDGTDTKIGLFGSKRKNVEVLTEESRNQLFTNQHLKSYSASTGLRSDLYKKELAGTSGTFLSYVAAEATSFFIDYSLKQVGSSITFVRTGTLRMINGVPQSINLAKLTDTNVEVHQDIANIGVVDANEMSNIVFAAAIDGSNIKVNYTQDINFTTEISYTVKRWTM